jgi:hypothetical protein
LKKRGDGERSDGGRASDTGLRDITKTLLIWLIESEINSAFIFVAVARTAYLAANFSDGNTARSKAEAIYLQASELARDSCGEAQQAIADHLRDLRQAIDGLMTGEVNE